MLAEAARREQADLIERDIVVVGLMRRGRAVLIALGADVGGHAHHRKRHDIPLADRAHGVTMQLEIAPELRELRPKAADMAR